jgi:hypothetical protein
MTKESKLILITDILEHKKRKEDELEFYNTELKSLLVKMETLRREVTLTKDIINMIEKEEVKNII